MTRNRLMSALLAATALCGGANGAAVAQDAPSGEQTLGEIVVTANRQTQTLGRVPMSVAAVTQETLTQKGVFNIADLARSVPALTFRPTASQPITAINGTLVSIRGIISASGSGTTGIYVDDIPLQRRGLGTAGSGIPFPKLFDVERVEVLRGPQGTLYGGSSQGGAIRFLTPTPSVSRRSGALRFQVSATEGGDPSGELDAAVGGPIIQDKLGFRISGMASTVGGYVDHIHPGTGRLLFRNSNWERSYAVRASLLWKPTERLSIQPSYFYAHNDKHDVDSYWQNVPGYTLPAASFGANGQPASATNPARFTRPALVYPALTNYGVGKTGETQTSPRKDFTAIYALTVGYDFGEFDFKSITGFERDTVAAFTSVAINLQNIHAPLWGGWNQTTPTFMGSSNVWMNHKSMTQEFRLTSRPDRRLTWVAGAFYNNSVINSVLKSPEHSLDEATRTLRGVTATTFYGVDFEQAGHITAVALQDWNDISLAGFADGTFSVTDKLKVNAGVRVSKEKFTFRSCTYGIARNISTCTLANANFLPGESISSSPVSPKFGLSYQIDERNMVYVTTAKGFRTGGVNTPVPNSPTCGAAVALIGGTPTTFDPDFVRSYEAGAKLRLFGGRALVNSSVFRIDWTDLQLQVALPGCPFTYTANAGAARSQGFDSQASVRLFGGLTADVSVAYTDAKYTRTTNNRDPAGGVISVVAFAGDELPIAPWTVDLGLTYDFRFSGDRRGYARLDYQYSSPFHRTTGPGSISYAADVYQAKATQLVNARVGAVFDRLDVSLFAKNLLNSSDTLDLNGGRICGRLVDPNCAAPTQTSFLFRASTFRPREVGVTVNYRY